MYIFFFSTPEEVCKLINTRSQNLYFVFCYIYIYFFFHFLSKDNKLTKAYSCLDVHCLLGNKYVYLFIFFFGVK